MKCPLLALCFALLALQACTKNREPKPTFSAIVNGHSIEITFRYGTLDPKKRKVELRETKDRAGDPDFQWLLQGKPVLGTDNSDPRRGFSDGTPYDVIESITVVWDGIQRQVPADLFDNIVHPHRDTNIHSGKWVGMYFVVDP